MPITPSSRGHKHHRASESGRLNRKENHADKSLTGKSKEPEVASRLVDEGFYVFWPFVDKGFDLIVTDENGKKFVPIQVKYRTKDPGPQVVQ